METLDYLIRVSKMDQRDEDDDTTVTVQDQRKSAIAAIEARGARVGKEIKALDSSGWTVYQSAGWLEALERVKRGDSNGWSIAYDDRLGRNWRKAGRYYDEAEEAGAVIVFANLPGVDYRDDDGRTLTGILAVVAERQYLGARKRGNNIADQVMARGVPNRVAYGYRRNADADGVKTDAGRDAKALVLDTEPLWEGGPSKAGVVEQIYAWRLAGWGIGAIRRELNAAGIPSPRGAQWVTSSVSTVIACPQYKGWVVLGKNRDAVENAHAWIVTPNDWKRANALTKPIQRNGNLVAGIAGGILRCSGCGNTLRVIGTGKAGRKSYGCARNYAAGDCQRPVYVKKSAMDDFVEAIVLDALANRNIGAVASSRRLAELREAVRVAGAEHDAFVRNTPADSRAYRVGLPEREATLERAEGALADALARADEASELPDPSAWADATDDTRSRVALHLLAGIEVAPPISRSKFAPILDRLSVTWADDGDDGLAIAA